MPITHLSFYKPISSTRGRSQNWGVHEEVSVDIPQSLFVGMTLFYNQDYWEVVSVTLDVINRRVNAHAIPRIKPLPDLPDIDSWLIG